MTPKEHAKELSRLRGLVTRARTRMKVHKGTLATKLALNAAVGRAESAVREHQLAFYTLTCASEPATLLNQAEAEQIATWVCSHDTGVKPSGEAVLRPNGWVVVVRGQEVAANGTVNDVAQDAHTYADARAILGY